MTTNIFRNATMLGAIVLAISVQAIAVPVIDGRFDPNEGYTTGNALSIAVERSTTIVRTGRTTLEIPGPVDGRLERLLPAAPYAH
jgi:hypothetical protein